MAVRRGFSRSSRSSGVERHVSEPLDGEGFFAIEGCCTFYLQRLLTYDIQPERSRRKQQLFTIWGGSVSTGEESPPHSEELKHALLQAGGPTQSQLNRPMSSGHHTSVEHRLRRKHLQVNFYSDASNETFVKEIQEKRKRRNFFLRKKTHGRLRDHAGQVPAVFADLQWMVPAPCQTVHFGLVFGMPVVVHVKVVDITFVAQRPFPLVHFIHQLQSIDKVFDVPVVRVQQVLGCRR